MIGIRFLRVRLRITAWVKGPIRSKQKRPRSEPGRACAGPDRWSEPIFEEEHRVADRAQFHPLMTGGEKPAAPETGVERLGRGVGVFGEPDHKGGQIPLFTAQAIAHPGADAWPARLLMAGLEKSDGWIVIDGFGAPEAGESGLEASARSFGSSTEDRATVPMPELRRPKKWRRVRSIRPSSMGFIVMIKWSCDAPVVSLWRSNVPGVRFRVE